MKYLIVGEIGGDQKLLESLLSDQGYHQKAGRWTSTVKKRKLLFLGDVFGPHGDNIKIYETLKALEKEKLAIILMGDFEYQLLGYLRTIKKENPFSSINEKYAETYTQFQNEKSFSKNELIDLIKWLRKRPLYYKDDGLSAIHACWHDQSLNNIEGLLNGNGIIREGIMDLFYDPLSPANIAIKTILNGQTIKCPVNDKDFLLRWWCEKPSTYKQALHDSHEEWIDHDAYPDLPVTTKNKDLIFFSHYPITMQRQNQTEKKLCLGKPKEMERYVLTYEYDGSHEINHDCIKIQKHLI